MNHVPLPSVARSPLSVPAALAVLLAVAAPARAQGVIEAHRDAKLRLLAAAPDDEHAAVLARAGFDGADAGAESVAIYVDRHLRVDEIRALEARGVRFSTTFVPAVEGRHPHGFHLARVPYARLAEVALHPRVQRLATTEIAAAPADDLGDLMIDLDDVYEGDCHVDTGGQGLRVAVIDSGYDLTHPDLPAPVEAYDVTDGSSPATWGTDVTNTVSGHGTFVAGLMVGDGGLSGGKYRGPLSEAELHVYKIGNDVNASATWTDMIEAIDRARATDCDIANLSYGGWSTFHDGSAPVCQAVDAARAAGMLVFVSAGNWAESDRHDSVELAAGVDSEALAFRVDNLDGAGPIDPWHWIQVAWREESGQGFDLELVADDLGPLDFISPYATETSPRGTKARGFWVYLDVPAFSEKTVQLRLRDSGASSGTTLAHLYRGSGSGRFVDADPNYTITSPAFADGAVAVGAWTQRKQWVDSEGNPWSYDWLEVDTLASFSSRGPRVDGLAKPDLVAPGAAAISTRDSNLHDNPSAIIDDDGVPGVGGAHYYLGNGTSYAAPVAAAVAGLLLETDQSLTADQLVEALTTSAAPLELPTTDAGAGLLDAYAALQGLASNPCPSLLADTRTISLQAGATHELRVNFGDDHAHDLYLLLGSSSGTTGGPVLDGLTLPLTPDGYLRWTVTRANEGFLVDTFGSLDDEGRAAGALVVPPGSAPVLTGVELHHAALALRVDGAALLATAVSNPVGLRLE